MCTCGRCLWGRGGLDNSPILASLRSLPPGSPSGGRSRGAALQRGPRHPDICRWTGRNSCGSLPRSQQHPGPAAYLSAPFLLLKILSGPQSIPYTPLCAGVPANPSTPLPCPPFPTFFDLFVYFFPWQPPVSLCQTAQAPYNLKLICLTAASRQEGWEFI